MASGNPEPDSEADCWTEIECAAPIRQHPGYPNVPDAMICRNGHDRLPYEIEHAPGGPAWQREQNECHGGECGPQWQCSRHSQLYQARYGRAFNE